jgi:hypothetical protein
LRISYAERETPVFEDGVYYFLQSFNEVLKIRQGFIERRKPIYIGLKTVIGVSNTENHKQ